MSRSTWGNQAHNPHWLEFIPLCYCYAGPAWTGSTWTGPAGPGFLQAETAQRPGGRRKGGWGFLAWALGVAGDCWRVVLPLELKNIVSCFGFYHLLRKYNYLLLFFQSFLPFLSAFPLMVAVFY
ncbi:hypothetical protein MA16_Dca014346 [Dendrobium catenatum]|uniref:Uncharacterized protein n=1 Tax=Dendrobium catenatum TaxID=906689 RepID=A0A2I0WWG0_9ASPA|nr:hypothetical protein MA16_Dca014346 [Dendrobium catenatum]